MRPERDDIGAPEFPEKLVWLGEAPESMAALTAPGPVLVHFIDFAQLNSVRSLPYLVEWERRYGDAGLRVIGIQVARFPFGFDPEVVGAGLARLGVEFPVAIDPGRDLWRLYGCEGWPSLFLWGQGGALRWVHFGEGEYEATEEAIQEELREINALRELPRPLDPLRVSDSTGAKVMPPSEEEFPGGEDWVQPWLSGVDGNLLKYSYAAGGVHATIEGAGHIAFQVDDAELQSLAIEGTGLYTFAEHRHHERHRITLHPEEGLAIWSVSFSAGVP